MHAYGLAVDLNTVENPYVGCGQSQRPRELAIPQSLSAPAWDGDPQGRQRLPLDRVGLGRCLGGLDEGLHALLVHRALAHGCCPPSLKTRHWPSVNEPAPAGVDSRTR